MADQDKSERSNDNIQIRNLNNAPKSVKDLAGNIKKEIDFKTEVRGTQFNDKIGIDDILLSYRTTGIQASNLYCAIEEIKKMKKNNAKIYIGATSNMISSGIRENLRYLAENSHFQVLVLTGGGIEEDLIKCFKPTYLGNFYLDGQDLRDNGWNRIGNMVINNENYMVFEKWFNKIMDEIISGLTEEFPNKNKNGQLMPYTEERPLILTPSKFIRYLGKKINNEESVLYWCYKNNINVYSPALTDGSIGDLLTFYHKRTCFKLDIVEDIYRINTECLGGQKNGGIILGGGLVKHHVLNANLFNNGLDYCVIINTAHEFDASDTGASITEAYSWGKVKSDGTCIKVHGDCSIIFPLVVYGAFISKKI